MISPWVCTVCDFNYDDEIEQHIDPEDWHSVKPGVVQIYAQTSDTADVCHSTPCTYNADYYAKQIGYSRKCDIV